MPSMETAARHQTALLWETDGSHDAYGNPQVAANAAVLKVRWNNGRMQSVDGQGNAIALDAVVVTDRDVAVGSIMWEGTLAEYEALVPGTGTGTNTPLPADLDDLHEVVHAKVTKDIKGRAIRRTLGLRRYSRTMPDNQ